MMKNKAEQFFTESEKARISQAVSEAEQKTSGELVVMVTAASARYSHVQMLVTMILGALAAWCLSLAFWPQLLWWHFLLLVLPLCLLAYLIIRAFPGLVRPLIHSKELEATVIQAASAAFLAKGLDRTRDRTGVLFFISLFERRVRVLADTGIYAKIGQETLDRYAATVAEGLRDGKSADALCQAIAAAGEALAKHFPIAPDDTNELPNGVIIE